MVATAVLSELHVTSSVMFCTVPSLNRPAALKSSVVSDCNRLRRGRDIDRHDRGIRDGECGGATDGPKGRSNGRSSRSLTSRRARVDDLGNRSVG